MLAREDIFVIKLADVIIRKFIFTLFRVCADVYPLGFNI